MRSQGDELLAQYTAAAARRRVATDTWLSEIEDYQSDVRRDGEQITKELLEGFFDETSDKSDRVRKWAREAKRLLNTFDQAAVLLTSSIATMSLQLRMAQDTLAFEVIATPIREIGKPITTHGRTPLQIAKEGVASIKSANTRLNGNFLNALADARLLEQEAERTIIQAVELIRGRRRRLFDFRRRNLSFSWHERLTQAQEEGKKAGKEEAADLAWEAVEELAQALLDEAADITQAKRVARWGGAVTRAGGQRTVNRERNDTDQVDELLDQLQSENERLKKLDTAFVRSGAAIEAIRASADNSYEGHQTH